MINDMTIKPTGVIRLELRKKSSGKTYLARQFYDLPLQVLPPYYQDDDGTAFVYLLNPTGGVLQGDRLLTEIKVEKDARALITTPSANKLYKMEDDHAEILNEIHVEEGGVLEFIPEYNIPYAKSSTYQESIFHIHDDSILFTWDMVIPGRVDLGEYFDYDLYSSKIKIYVNGKLKAYEFAKLTPIDGTINGVGMMEGHGIYSTIIIYGKELPEDLLTEIQRKMEATKGIKGGISLIEDSMVCIKILGQQVTETWETMMSIWATMRKALLNKGRVKIRKY